MEAEQGGASLTTSCHDLGSSSTTQDLGYLMRLTVICLPGGRIKWTQACGEGEQTIKWLSLAVAQRYALLKGPGPPSHSRSRRPSQEEKETDNKSKEGNREPPPGFYLPVKVTCPTTGKDLDDPYALIKDVVPDGATVEVTLQQELKVDEVGAPVMTDFANEAFYQAETRLKREMDGERRLKAEADAHSIKEKIRRDSDVTHVSLQMKVLITGHIETPAEIRAALAYDWPSVRVGEIEPSNSMQATMRDVLQEHFTMINEIFLHLSALPSLGDGGAVMALGELAHLLHRAKILHAHDDKVHVVQIFREAHGNINDVPSGRPVLLNRGQFVGALIRAAVICQHEAPVGYTVAASKTLVTGTAAKLLGVLLSIRKNFLPNEKDELYQAFKTKVMLVVDSNKAHLYRLFREYAVRPRNQMAVDYPNVISYHSFRKILVDAGLAEPRKRRRSEMKVNADGDNMMDEKGGDDDQEEGKDNGMIKVDFDGYVEEAISSALAGMGICQEDIHGNGLVFAEFIEATCRLAVGLDPRDLVPEQKMQLALAALLDANSM